MSSHPGTSVVRPVRAELALLAALALLLSTGPLGCGVLVGGAVLGINSSGGGSGGDSNTAPAATILEPESGVPLNDRIEIRYLLIDGESQNVDVAVSYQIGAGPFLDASPVADFGHDGTTGLSTLPGGVEHLFVWNSSLDLGDTDHAEVRVRIVPTDQPGAVGGEEISAAFPLLNRRIATFAGGEVHGDLLIGPSGLWLDEDQRALYVADDLASKVQRIDLETLEVTLVAGNALKGFDEDDVLATGTSLDDPSSVLRLGDFLYVGTAFRVRSIRTSTGFIKTAIGTGMEESSGDGGFPESAGIEDQVFGLAHDSQGNIYFTEESHLRVWSRQSAPVVIAGQEVEAGTIETVGEEGDEPEDWQRLTMDEADRLYVMSPDGLYLLNTTGDDLIMYGDSEHPVTIPPGELGKILGPVEEEEDEEEEDDEEGDDEEDDDEPVLLTDPSGGHAMLTELSLEECKVVLPSEGGRYVFSAEDHRIRAVDMSSGLVETIAGTGIARNDGDGGPAGLASIHGPRDLALSRDGLLFLACTSAIRVINLGRVALPLGPDMIQPGEIRTVATNDPGDFLVADDCLALGPDDSVYTMDSTSNALIQVHPLTRERTVVVGPGGAFAGDGGPAVAASSPGYTLALDPDGNLVIGSDGRLRVVNRQSTPIVVAGVTIQPGHIDTICGNGDESSGGDGGPAGDATFSGPEQIVIDGMGGIYICDEGRIRMLNAGTAPRTVAGVLIPPGAIDTIVGTGNTECDGDGGPATEASCDPIGVSLDSAGNIYVVDASCAGVRVVNVTRNELVLFPGGVAVRVAPGAIETIVGTGESGRFSADGLTSLDTQLSNPRSVYVHTSGMLICDAGARRLRRVDPDTGLVTTVVGTGEPGFNGNAIPLENVRLAPELVDTDSLGRLYVLDGTGRVRRFLLE